MFQSLVGLSLNSGSEAYYNEIQPLRSIQLRDTYVQGESNKRQSSDMFGWETRPWDSQKLSYLLRMSNEGVNMLIASIYINVMKQFEHNMDGKDADHCTQIGLFANNR